LVGTQTVLDDNPKLDSRDWKGNNPVRIVLDRSGKIPDSYFVKDNSGPTIIVTEIENLENSSQISFENAIFGSNLAQSILEILHKKDIQSVIIEGGKKTLQTFIDANLWDEARVFKGTNSFGDGTKSPDFRGNLVSKKTILNDELLIFKSV